MICFPTVFDLLLLGSAGLLLSPKIWAKCCPAVDGPVEVGEGFDFVFDADAGFWNADAAFAPLSRPACLNPGGDALAQGFCWFALNLDTCTLGDWSAPSPGLGDTAGDLEGDPGDGDGDGSLGERRAAPKLANGIRGPEPTDGFGAPGFDGGHKGRGVVEAGPGGPLSPGGHVGPSGPGGLDGPCRRIV